MNQQYDVIVIGTGEKTRSAVRTLSEQGQQVMYIELLPEMLTTMVCHHPKKNPSSQEYDTNKEQNQMKTKIHLQKHTVQTSVGETITYTFHVEESVEITEVERVEIDDPIKEEWESSHPYLYQHTDNHQQKVEPLHVERVEDFYDHIDPSIDSAIHDNIYYEEESSSANAQEEENIFYEIDDEVIEHEQETIDFTEEIESSSNKKEEVEEAEEKIILSQTLKPSTLSQQKEREHALREKLIRRKGKPEPSNLLTGNYSVEESFNEQEDVKPISDQKETEMDRSAFLHSVLNKPSYSPRDTRLRKRLSFKPKLYQTTEKKQTTEKEEENHFSLPSKPVQQEQKETSEKQNIYSFEPISTRRRARAQKKNRMLTSIQRTHSHSVSVQPEESTAQEDMDPFESSGSSPSLVDESSSKQEALMAESSSQQGTTDIHSLQSTEPKLSMESASTTTELLKKDNIDIEEPYGGYNSLEDFFPPYSSGRKRQEMDEIEKRKIALRGLHNLINNLG